MDYVNAFLKCPLFSHSGNSCPPSQLVSCGGTVRFWYLPISPWLTHLAGIIFSWEHQHNYESWYNLNS